MPEPNDDDSAEIEVVIGTISTWFEGLDVEDVEDCAGEIVEALLLKREDDDLSLSGGT
jgi:hypothetical protein